MKYLLGGIDEVIDIFKTEFQTIVNKFTIIKVLNGISFNLQNILDAKIELIYHPGVYVFYGNNKVWKVGRHLDNSRKRATEHIIANTKNNKHNIKELESIPDAEIILFNIVNKEDYHWVAAVEIFLERELQPLIPSKRTG